MSNFTQAEIAYLQSQPLGRLATVNASGDPHVVPVGYRYNAELDTIDIGGRNMGQSKKYHEAVRHGRVSFVVDDVLPPWKPRGIEIRGRAEAITTDEHGGPRKPGTELIRIHPTRIVGWGLDSDAYKPNSRSV